MNVLFVVVFVLCVIALPLYLIWLSLVWRRVWGASKTRGVLLVLVVPALLVPLATPMLIGY